MGAIGGIIDSAVEVATGSSHGTTLRDFLSHFSSSEWIWAQTIDPFTTFDVSIKFFPSFYWPIAADSGKKTLEKTLEKLGDSLVSSAKGAVKSLANNVTGGLLGSFMNSKVDIMKKHDENPDA